MFARNFALVALLTGRPVPAIEVLDCIRAAGAAPRRLPAVWPELHIAASNDREQLTLSFYARDGVQMPDAALAPAWVDLWMETLIDAFDAMLDPPVELFDNEP